MRIDLAFGKTGITAELPEGFRYRVLEARSAAPLADPDAAIVRALREPIGAPPLAELARGKKSAAISVCDITRPAPNRRTLPPVLATLEAAGIARENITILIATGLHRPASEAEIREICGEEIASRYRVVNHRARELGEHRALGSTAAGTPVWVDARFLDADLHLTLGFIEPHLMLGFSGGRKLVVPGLAGEPTIKALHSPRWMRDTRSVEGFIGGNPLHREFLEIARMARHDFILDAVLARDRSIAGVFAGHSEIAHRAGYEFVAKVMLETLDEPVDAVVTTAAGYPLDLTYYQSIKGITAAAHIVKPGGPIVLAAACSEGAGAAEFSRMLLDGLSESEFLQQIAGRPEVVVDQWQIEKLALVSARNPVFWYVPGLPAEYHAKLWGRACASLQEALRAATAELRPGATIAVIPEGPYVLAKTAEGVAAIQAAGR